MITLKYICRAFIRGLANSLEGVHLRGELRRIRADLEQAKLELRSQRYEYAMLEMDARTYRQCYEHNLQELKEAERAKEHLRQHVRELNRRLNARIHPRLP